MPQVPSTSTKALELLEMGVKEGTVVITDNQTAGRGRQGQSWFSGAGKGLAFSIILTPNITFSSAGLFALMAGIAVSDVIEKFQLIPQLKWPNDIMISGKKCGGILVETRLQGNKMTSAIVGIGLNVNESTKDFPEAIRSITTSLSLEKGSPVQRERVLARTLNAIEYWYFLLKSGKNELILSSWEHRCAHLGKTVNFFWKNKITSGIFDGITGDGKAEIRLLEDSGSITLSSEEISTFSATDT